MIGPDPVDATSNVKCYLESEMFNKINGVKPPLTYSLINKIKTKKRFFKGVSLDSEIL